MWNGEVVLLPGLGYIQFRNGNYTSIKLELKFKFLKFKMQLQLKILQLQLHIAIFFFYSYHSAYSLTNHYQRLPLTEELTIHGVNTHGINNEISYKSTFWS